jgi:hypothetical protein
MIILHRLGLIILAGSGACLSGCGERVSIKSAHMEVTSPSRSANIRQIEEADSESKWYRLTILVNAHTLWKIVHNETNILVAVSDCIDKKSSYPSPAFLEAISLDEQRRAAEMQLRNRYGLVIVEAYAPAAFADRLDSVCVSVEGGNYLGMSLTSNKLRVR